MVYLHFPSQFTEEEEMLLKKYEKLKRKKKALQLLKAPKPEPPPVQKQLTKRVSESKQDAKEVAKKLLKSGAISAIKIENKERHGFKRSKASERKRSLNDRPGGIGYQPYTANHPSEEEQEPTTPSGSRPAMKSLYESFISANNIDDEESKVEKELVLEKERDGHSERPKQGNTVYVRGYGVTEEILRKGFTPFGNIINISMEMDKNCGFVTFEKIESADKAISEMNGSMVSGIQLKVSLARRQPLIPPLTDTSPTTWTTLAASFTQKGSHQDKRELITYADDLF